MPELPEVETVVRDLRGPLVGRKLRKVTIGPPVSPGAGGKADGAPSTGCGEASTDGAVVPTASGASDGIGAVVAGSGSAGISGAAGATVGAAG